MRGMRANESGVTLMELMIVVGVAAILMSILVLGIRQVTESFALRRAATTAISEVRRAQAAALAQRTDYMVEFELGTPGQINVSRAKLTTESCPSGMNAASPTLCERMVAAPEEWPASVALVEDSSPPPGMASLNAAPSCTAPGAGDKCVVFQFLGSPASVGTEAMGTVLLQSRTGVTRRIAIAAGTGNVSVVP